jgi:hypothetical protein
MCYATLSALSLDFPSLTVSLSKIYLYSQSSFLLACLGPTCCLDNDAVILRFLHEEISPEHQHSGQHHTSTTNT